MRRRMCVCVCVRVSTSEAKETYYGGKRDLLTVACVCVCLPPLGYETVMVGKS
jgi:hypothetical protein